MKVDICPPLHISMRSKYPVSFRSTSLTKSLSLDKHLLVEKYKHLSMDKYKHLSVDKYKHLSVDKYKHLDDRMLFCLMASI